MYKLISTPNWKNLVLLTHT